MNLNSINPLRTGAIGVLVIAVALLAAVLVPKVAFTANTDEYTANVANASGLRTGDQVYVAGVPSGRVTDMRLAKDHVAVEFRLDHHQHLRDRSSAEIKIQTVLGKRYLSVRPGGSSRMRPGEVIPVSRTSVPFDVGKLSRSASAKTGRLDTGAIRDAMSTLDRNLPHDPKLIGHTLQGITGVSKLLAKRNGQIQRLLDGAKSATDMLVGQRQHISSLLGNAKVLARYLAQQRTQIGRLLKVTNHLTGQLNKLIAANKAKVGPLLANLRTLGDGLHKHKRLLSNTLQNLHNGTKYLSNATGNGPWIDFAVPGLALPDNLACTLGLAKGCK